MREYARMFGLPPVRDVARFKRPIYRMMDLRRLKKIKQRIGNGAFCLLTQAIISWD
jgi:hypothetical protein